MTPVGLPVNPGHARLPIAVSAQVDKRVRLVASATIVTVFLQLAGVWLSSIGLASGAAAAWAWWREEDVQASAANGAAIGFIYGIPVTACAAIMLVCRI